MATKTNAPVSLAAVGNTVANVASQVQKGGMTQSQINSAISSLQGAQSQLSSGVSSGAYKSGVDYAQLDRPVAISSATTGVPTTAKAPVITPEAIKTQSMQFPIAPMAQDYNALTQAAGLTTLTPEQAVETSKNNQIDALKQMAEFIGEPRSIEQEMRNSAEQARLEAARKQENDLSGQLAQITNQGQAQQLAVVGQGRGIPEAIIGGQQAQIARETAIQALPVAAQLQWAQGNTANAEKTLDRLYQYRSQDIQNEFNYKKDLGGKMFEIASTAEQNKLKIVLDAEAARTKQAQENLAYSREMQSMALKTGQGNLVSKLASIDPKSANFNRDIGNVVSQIKDPLLGLSIAQKNLEIEKTKKEIAMIGAPTKEAIKAEKEALKNAKSTVPVMQGKVDLLDSLIKSPALGSTVGTTGLSRYTPGILGTFKLPIPFAGDQQRAGLWDTFTGTRQNFIAGVNQLVSKEFLDSVLQLKAQGGTLGQVTENEGKKLQAAATKIGTWEQKDKNGNITGYNASENDFIGELNKLKTAANNILIEAQRTSLGSDEDNLLEQVYQNKQVDIKNVNMNSLF